MAKIVQCIKMFYVRMNFINLVKSMDEPKNIDHASGFPHPS